MNDNSSSTVQWFTKTGAELLHGNIIIQVALVVAKLTTTSTGYHKARESSKAKRK